MQDAIARGGLHLDHYILIDAAGRMKNHFAGGGLTVGHSLGVGVNASCANVHGRFIHTLHPGSASADFTKKSRATLTEYARPAT